MTKNLFKLILFTTIITPTLAVGQLPPKQLKESGQWVAFKYGQNKDKVCYVSSIPIKMTGKYKKRGQSYIMISHRPSDKPPTLNVFEHRAGYTYKRGSEVTVEIGSQKFRLYTNADSAWAKDSKTDENLVRSMIKGNKLVLRGTSNRGTKTVDTYSLSGFTATFRASAKACKLKKTL